MCVGRHRGYAQIVVARPGGREEIGGSRTEGGSGYHVPDIMASGEASAPGNIGGEDVGRDTELPTVSALEESCGRESYGGVSAGKGVPGREIGTLFMDRGFQYIGRADRGDGCEATLLEAFPILIYEDSGQRGYG